MNKKLILSLLGISLSPIINSNLILESEASNISKTQEDLSPLITYTTEQIGDREKMKVTVTVEDRSGSGIKEFRDYNNKLINGNSYTFEITKRGDYTFTAIDNNNLTSAIQIDDLWINPYTKGIESRIDRGSSYWTSSNIREWLNSDLEEPRYTSIAYKAQDKGFLNEFTEDEKDAIAVTERRVLVNQNTDSIAKEGGGGDPGHLNVYDKSSYLANHHGLINYKSFGYKKELDKVFLLTPHEGYWYIERRGNSHKKVITDKVKEKHNRTNLYSDWWMQGGTIHSSVDCNYAFKNTEDLPGYIWYCSDKLGVVPAINIKPEYVFSNGKVAGNLSIGDRVVFGRYMNESIEWEVINISDDNYPLLLSSNIIELKEFDTPGDQSRLYSDYINFSSYDVSLFDDVQYKSKNGYDDIAFPTIKILNEEELELRQNNSFILNLDITDKESGLDYIELPDKSKIKFSNSDIERHSNINYTFSSNGNYVFKVMDIAGNYNEFLIPINNINQSPDVNIIQSNKDWSSEGVIIDIDSSANVKYISDLLQFSTGKAYASNAFPNYASYIGKKFTMSGYVEVESYKPEILDKNLKFGVGFYYNTKTLKEETYVLSGIWNTVKEINLNDIIKNGKQYFEYEYVIPNNYAYNLKPRLWVTNFYNSKGDEISVKVTDLKYECLDTNDFAIQSIELPDGTIIEDTSYSYKIEEDGIHNLTYKVLDNRGKITEKTITVKVDKTTPTLDLNYNTNITNQNIIVNISASDATSGVKQIKLPNGNYITNLNSTYTISGDGEYTFECEDMSGNITTKTISINNIDKEKPNVNIDKNNTDWTNKPVKININSRD